MRARANISALLSLTVMGAVVALSFCSCVVAIGTFLLRADAVLISCCSFPERNRIILLIDTCKAFFVYVLFGIQSMMFFLFPASYPITIASTTPTPNPTSQSQGADITHG